MLQENRERGEAAFDDDEKRERADAEVMMELMGEGLGFLGNWLDN